MQLVTLPDRAGDNARHRVSDFFRDAGVTLPSPPLAYMLLIREISAGTTNSRLGDANVTTTNGIPLNSADSVALPSMVSGGNLSQGAWNLDDLYIFHATADTLSIAAALI